MFGVLEERGYTTVVSAAGTLNPWPEGERFYGFDLYLLDPDFGYRGPGFSFVPVPDQFSIRVVHEMLLKDPEGGPFFIVYLSLSPWETV